MAKISPVSAKYIVHTQIQIEGVVDKPDVIGAIFGQTEGLLGNELELRELQRSGRIGRIEVNLDVRGGKTSGTIIIPSSLDKTETSIIGASLETIQRIGPCNSKVRIEKIEDVRISKRNFVIERAKELLRELTSGVLPDSQELTDQVAQSVRMMEVTEYGVERLAAGPSIDDAEEVVVVEGRADVLNLLKQGIKNVIAMNGTSAPATIKELGRKKVLTIFVDGDRGGDLIIRGLIDAGVEMDYVVKAPDGKEVEEITKKEIHKALRSKVAIEQFKMEGFSTPNGGANKIIEVRKPEMIRRPPLRSSSLSLSPHESGKFRELLDDLVGTKGAYILDEKLNVLGKVPVSELGAAIHGLPESYAIVLDGTVDRSIASLGERTRVKYMVATSSCLRPQETRINVLTQQDL